jgi:hypothetical protein
MCETATILKLRLASTNKVTMQTRLIIKSIALGIGLLVGGLNLFAAVVDDRKLSQSAQDEIADLMKEKASWTPAQCKLDSHLIHAMKLKQGKFQIRHGLQPAAESTGC